jgi:hypothetical protein
MIINLKWTTDYIKAKLIKFLEDSIRISSLLSGRAAT